MTDTPRHLIKLGARASVAGKEDVYGFGVIRYIGTTKFQPGEWVGIELDEPKGKNDGSVQGERYFTTKPNHGVFTKISSVSLWDIYNKSKVSPAAPAASAPAPVASTPTPASPSPSPPPPSQAAEPQSVAKGDTTQEPGNDTDLNDEIIRELIAEHEEERAKWQEEKEQLEAERDRLIAANAQLQRERDEAIAAQEKALQDAIALQKEAANQLKEDNALSAIQEQLTKALQQIDDLKKERDDAFQQIDVLKNERDTALNDKEQLSRELQHLKAQTPQAAGDDEIQSLKNEISKLQEELEDHQSQIELVTIDKELAEAQLEKCTNELAEAQKKIAELEDFKKMVEEKEEQKRIAVESGQIDSTSEAVEVLMQQNNRLKEALAALQEYSIQVQAERDQLKMRLDEFERQIIPSMEAKQTELEVKILEYEEQMHHLKEELDDAHALQEKFQTLFDQKMDLEEENRELKVRISDLEELQRLSEETEESNEAIIKKLRGELHTLQVELLDKEGTINNLHTTLQEKHTQTERLESYIAELRQALIEEKNKATKKDEENTDANKEASKSSEAAPVPQEIRQMLTEHALRTSAKLIEDEIRAVDVLQAQNFVSLIKMFVPESSIKTDMECASLLLLMDRLRAKSGILARSLYRQYRLDQLEHTNQMDEFLIFVWKLYRFICKFEYNSGAFLDAMRDCDEETYLRLGKLVFELTPYEKKIDHLITLVRNDEINAQLNIDDLQIVLDRFDFLVEKLIPKNNISAGRFFEMQAKEIAYNVKCIGYGELKLNNLLRVSEAEARSESQPLRIASSDKVKLIASICRKILRNLDERTMMKYSGTIQTELLTCSQLSTKLATTIDQVLEKSNALVRSGEVVSAAQVASLIDSTLHADQTPSATSSFETLNSIISQRSLDTSSIPNTEQSTLLDKYLDSIYCVLIAFLNELETGVYREEQQQLPRSPSTATQSPSATIKCRCFEERAKTIRVELESSLEIKNELEKYKQLVSERDQTIGAKTKTIDDLQWKIKKLEHRVAILEKEEKEQKELNESKQAAAVAREKTLEEQNSALQKLVDVLTASNNEMTSRLTELDESLRQARQQLAQSNTSSVSSSSVRQLSAELAGAREALRFLQEELLKQKAKEAQSALLNKLGAPLVVPQQVKVRQLVELRAKLATAKISKVPEEDTEPISIAKVEKEVQTLPLDGGLPKLRKQLVNTYKLVLQRAVAPQVVDLNSPVSPEAQLQAQEFERMRIASLVHKLEEKVYEVSRTSGLTQPAKVTPVLGKKVGKFTVKSNDTSANDARVVVVPITRQQLMQLHAKLV